MPDNQQIQPISHYESQINLGRSEMESSQENTTSRLVNQDPDNSNNVHAPQSVFRLERTINNPNIMDLQSDESLLNELLLPPTQESNVSQEQENQELGNPIVDTAKKSELEIRIDKRLEAEVEFYNTDKSGLTEQERTNLKALLDPRNVTETSFVKVVRFVNGGSLEFRNEAEQKAVEKTSRGILEKMHNNYTLFFGNDVINERIPRMVDQFSGNNLNSAILLSQLLDPRKVPKVRDILTDQFFQKNKLHMTLGLSIEKARELIIKESKLNKDLLIGNAILTKVEINPSNVQTVSNEKPTRIIKTEVVTPQKAPQNMISAILSKVYPKLNNYLDDLYVKEKEKAEKARSNKPNI